MKLPKTRSIVLGFLLLFLAVGIAQPVSAITVSVENGTAVPGGSDTVSIVIGDINATDDTGITAATIWLYFDNQSVNVSGVAAGDLGDLTSVPPPSTKSPFKMTAIKAFSVTGDSLVFADVTLGAIGPAGQSTLGLYVKTLNNDTNKPLLWNTTVSNGTFHILDVTPPSVTSPSADPELIANDTSSTSEISVVVTDNTEVGTVTVDLSSVGGDSEFALENGAEGGVFNGTIVANTDVLGWHYLPVNATDISGISNTTETIPINVVEPTLIAIDDVYIPPNSYNTVPILIYDAPNIVDATVKVEYNQSVIHITDITAGDFGSPIFTIDNTSGIATLSVSMGSPVSGDKTIANLNISGVGSAGKISPLNLTVSTLHNNNVQPVPRKVENGSVRLGYYGDVDLSGEVTAGDATLILRYTVDYPGTFDTPYGPMPYADIGDMPLADVDFSGEVDAGDATCILRYTVDYPGYENLPTEGHPV